MGRMKTVAAMTFHHAHNFGSVLQAYALQEYIKELYREADQSVDYKIIDYYTENQEELYSVFKSEMSAKALAKNLIARPYAKQLRTKHQKFEDFLKNRCQMTRRYRNSAELKNGYPKADVYISGSDQIWNVRARDFSPAYYFDFLDDQAKRISYAASLGPLEIDWTKYDAEGCKMFLKKYSAISVREQGSADNIKKIIDVNCSIHVDPTILLTAEHWRKIQSDIDYNGGRYILLYCLEPSRLQLEMADAVSKKLNLPIVVLRYNNKNDMFNHFVKKYDSGPEDFLAYIDHAALVLSSSFHGTAFSLIYHKPFYVFNGMKDHRIASILEKMNMRQRSLETINDVARVTLNPPDGDVIESLFEQERKASREYLRSALEIE